MSGKGTIQVGDTGVPTTASTGTGTSGTTAAGTRPSGTSTTDSASPTTTTDACAGGEDPGLELGRLGDAGFVPWDAGDDAPLDEDAGGDLGLPITLRVRGLDQTDQLSVLVDLYVGDELVQGAFGAVITDCTDGVGVGATFLPLEGVARRDELEGREASVGVTVTDLTGLSAEAKAEVVLR